MYTESFDLTDQSVTTTSTRRTKSLRKLTSKSKIYNPILFGVLRVYRYKYKHRPYNENTSWKKKRNLDL